MNSVPDYLQPGQETDIGSYCFSAEEIIRFAKNFDPQIFHLDAEAAKQTLFGGLCASGWHTLAIWMKLQRAHTAKHSDLLKQQTKSVPEFGPSPGFKELKWNLPVYAGDTITYKNRHDSIRPSKSRPGWWVLSVFSQGENQNGNAVISFSSIVLIRFEAGGNS